MVKVAVTLAVLLLISTVVTAAGTSGIGYKATNGTWMSMGPINIKSEATTYNGVNYDWGGHSGVQDIYFRNNSNLAKAILYTNNGYYFVYDLSGAQLLWQEKAGQPGAWNTLGGGCSSNSQDTQIVINTATNSTATYAGAFCNTNITYVATSDMLKETLILTGLPSIKDYLYLSYGGHIFFNATLDICANGQCYRPNLVEDSFRTSGQIDFRTQANKTMFYLKPPTIHDSAGHTTVGTYVVHGSNAQMVYELRINQTFLSTATFPVYIDPTVVSQEEKRVDFYTDDTNYVSGQLFKYVDNSWNKSIDEVFVYFDATNFKFGGNDSSNTGSERYLYNFTSTMDLTYDPVGVEYDFSNNFYHLNFNDICLKPGANCQITQPTSTNVQVDFYSDSTIDPKIQWGQANVTIQVDSYMYPWFNSGSSVEQKLLAVDNNTGILYVAETKNRAGGIFGWYNYQANSSGDLSATDAGDWMSTTGFGSLYSDPDGRKIWLGMSGKWGYYNITGNVSKDLTGTTSGIGTNYIEVAADNNRKMAFVFQDAANAPWWIYNMTTNTSKVMPNLPYNVKGACLDRVLGKITLIMSSGQLYSYNIATNVTSNITSLKPTAWGANGFLDCDVDEKRSLVYLAVGNAYYGVLNETSNTITDLSSTDAGNFVSGTNSPASICADTDLGGSYMGGGSGLFATYLSTNATTDLSTTDVGNWLSNKLVSSCTYDSYNQVAYVGLNQPGSVGVYIKLSWDGNTCSSNATCRSGICKDGVCCNAPCTSLCQRCSGSSPTWLGTNGTCSSIAADQDPDTECGAVSCQSPTAYYWGWSGLTCEYRNNVADGNCDGSGACRTAAYYCPSQSMDGSTGTTCSCAAALIGCTGTTSGSCDNNLCNVVTVFPISNQNPTQSGVTTVPCVFNVSFTPTLSSAKCVFTQGGVTVQNTTGNCIQSGANITCAVNMNFYNLPGVWNVNASASDGSNVYYDSSKTFNYNSLTAFNVDVATISFGSLTVGTTQAATNNPLYVYNEGNIQINNVSVKGYDLASGTNTIPSNNLNITNVENTALSMRPTNNVYVQIPGIQVIIGASTYKRFNLYMTVPDPLAVGNYVSTNNWVVYVSN